MHYCDHIVNYLTGISLTVKKKKKGTIRKFMVSMGFAVSTPMLSKDPDIFHFICVGNWGIMTILFYNSR